MAPEAVPSCPQPRGQMEPAPDRGAGLWLALLSGAWPRGHRFCQTLTLHKSTRGHTERQGLRLPSDPRCLPTPWDEGCSGAWGWEGAAPHRSARGISQPPPPLPSPAAWGFAWAGARMGWGGVIKGSEPDRKLTLSCQPLQPPP